MESLIEFSREIIQGYGYWGVFFLTTIEHFIFPIPTEVFIRIGTASGLGINDLFWIVFVGTLVGSSIGYFLGQYLGHPAVVRLWGEAKIVKSDEWVKKWGIWAVIGAGFTPFPFALMTWFAGIFKMPFRKFILGVILGRITRYIILAYGVKILATSQFLAPGNWSAFLMGALQGVTEFLPISSSGHLIVMERFLNLPLSEAQTMSFDIFLHGGSLIAILIYFWADWVRVFKEAWKMLKEREIDKDSIFIKLALATVPAIIAGLAFGGLITETFRTLHWVATFFIVVGCLYFYTAWKGKSAHSEKVSLKKAVLIGMAQAVALLPGVSRAGSTIATGVALGIKPEVAARFSFMLGAVAILAANVYTILTLGGEGSIPDLTFVLTGAITAFVFSLGSIYVLMKYLQKRSMRAFGVYLILMGSFVWSFL